MKKKIIVRYVVLHGERGVSREFVSKNSAVRYAKLIKIKNPKKEVTVDYIKHEAGHPDDWYQGTDQVINKQPKKVRKVRKVRRVPFWS